MFFMDKKIVKVIYTDGEQIEVKDWKTPEQLKSEFSYGMDWKANRHYDRQFKDIERDVLWGLDDSIVKDYAKDHLDLKDEDENECDCDDKDVSDYEDNELMAELSRRNLFGYANVNIISIDLFTRFSRVITVADNQELETIIWDLEKKYNI
jgi:hypothetical protein